MQTNNISENFSNIKGSIEAINYSIELLEKDGVFVFTVPFGLNKYLDDNLKNIDLLTFHFYKRICKGNKWEECTWNEIKDKKYGAPYNAANGIVVVVYRKEK